MRGDEPAGALDAVTATAAVAAGPSALPAIVVAHADAASRLRLGALLQDRYRVLPADSGPAALRLAQQWPRPALLLVAAALPGVDGCAVCRQLKRDPDTAALPVIVLTDAAADSDDAGWRDGAADVMDDAVGGPALRARIDTQLRLCRASALLARQDAHLEQRVHERTAELSRMLDAVIWALASLGEMREYRSTNHIHRVQHYVAALARQLQTHPRFAAELSDDHVALLFQAAPLHDIGKVAIPDAILLKPGRLTDAEFAVMRRHTEFGRDAIAGVERRLGTSNGFLRYAREIAYSHQEKYDGSGYPQGLAGEAIPIAARLVTVADVYDALISRRVYKPAFTHETALELIRQGSGEHFDPDIVDALLIVEEQFVAIAAQFRDAD